jgi:hypothetical protein
MPSGLAVGMTSLVISMSAREGVGSPGLVDVDEGPRILPVEARQQRLGDGFGVGARDQAKEQELQQFIVGKGVGARGGEPLAQAVTVAEVMRLFLARLGFHWRLELIFGEETPLVAAHCRHRPPASP